jgi:hypothetical protein
MHFQMGDVKLLEMVSGRRSWLSGLQAAAPAWLSVVASCRSPVVAGWLMPAWPAAGRGCMVVLAGQNHYVTLVKTIAGTTDSSTTITMIPEPHEDKIQFISDANLRLS